MSRRQATLPKPGSDRDSSAVRILAASWLGSVPPVSVLAAYRMRSWSCGVMVVTRGVIAGLALRSIRADLALTQAGLAEALRVDANTIQSWETARRPLTRTRADEIAQLRHTLRVLGAQTARLSGLDQALTADWLLSSSLDPLGPRPLAHQVLTREVTQLLSWPLTGVDGA